ncbi:hypothetical protein K458DRAFT_416493 [Lentithecium fluviatile CBS 122367]|uniref:Calcofluor white hypersensitive protein n=1 Tax=Lentithecium fluviatile CBS 122367 TaxID=1168545 RepID=A0A6G1J7I0_9PLEO|nr:hypothetical protein K458DRAFT_416493 [Lentithecium fluviatile CBS 122367]
MSKRVLQLGGLAAVGGGAYYLYSAGGDPKLAQKKIEHDAATASAKVRSEIPGRGKEAQKAGEEGLESVRARAQSMADDAKAEAERAKAKLDNFKQGTEKKFEETGKEFNAAVNKFDKEVTQKASESKSWLGSWFGGK